MPNISEYAGVGPSHSTDSFTYEHFPVVCPTCRGTGEIAEEEANGLIAFLPFWDERLKPSRLVCKLVTVLITGVIIGGLALFFLFPRPITVSLTDIVPVNFTFVPNKNPRIILKFKMVFENKNFFPITLTSLNSQVFIREGLGDDSPHEVGDQSEDLSKKINLRDTCEIQKQITTTYLHYDGTWVKTICQNYKMYIFEQLSVSVKIHYWVHSEVISASKYYWLDCAKS